MIRANSLISKFLVLNPFYQSPTLVGPASRMFSKVPDQVNNHYVKTFGSVILLSVLSAGAQLSQPQNVHRSDDNPTINQTLAESLGTNLANTGTKLTTKNIDIQPTLEIRPGYIFNISVTKDMVFPGQYNEAKG